ncbi:MAG: histidine kinase [Actinomycetota bacterium]
MSVTLTTPATKVRPLRWPWAVFGVFLAAAAYGSILTVRNGESLANQVPLIIAFGAFGIVGALVVSRTRGNPVGLLLLYGSALTAVSFAAGEIMTALWRDGIRSGTAVFVAAFLSNAGWILGIIPVVLFLPLIFPDGRLPSRRWRPLAWITWALLLFLTASILLGQRTFTGSVESVRIHNPMVIGALADLRIPDWFVVLLLVVCLGGGVASLVSRFRRSSGVERQQIKWVAASIVFVIGAFAVTTIGSSLGDLFTAVVSGAAFLSIPVAIGVAVLQYRLYDLDVVVKKALIAGALAVIVIAVYGVLVWVFGTVASGRESSLSLFLIALALGLAFRPVARFARRVADRIVYGRRATPYEVLTEFSERVGDAYATDDVLERMAQILGQGVGATSARVWLQVGRELRPVSSWPPGDQLPTSLSCNGEALPPMTPEIGFEVRDRGSLLGALSVEMPPNDPMTPAKEKLVRDLASQAGLSLRNVQLVEDLRASRQRLVAAQDEERRKLERNIHDGAQQQLVALTVKMRLARSLASKDVAKAESMLQQMEGETQTALEDLRDLARGIYPPLLADQGLAAALEAQARKSVTPASVSADGVGRYPQDVEAAVYFSVLEALQNVAKYARASNVEISLSAGDGSVRFDVRDDGVGFDASSTGYGTGLQGIADRLSALGGRVAVRSAPGDGTTVAGELPVGPSVRDEEPASTPEPIPEPASSRSG